MLGLLSTVTAVDKFVVLDSFLPHPCTRSDVRWPTAMVLAYSNRPNGTYHHCGSSYRAIAITPSGLLHYASLTNHLITIKYQTPDTTQMIQMSGWNIGPGSKD